MVLSPLSPARAVTDPNDAIIARDVACSVAIMHKWVKDRDYAGHDPFDLLNSPLLRPRWARQWPLGIAFIQLGKLSGWRLRRWLRVPESKNPKALGLCMAACCDLARCGQDTRAEVGYLKSELKRLRSPQEPEYCWGYDWDHVSRGGRMPAFSPNAVVTYFCAIAFLEMAEVFGDSEAFDIARSSGRFVTTRLNRSLDTPEYLCLGYTPINRARIYNASALCGALLARLAATDGVDQYFDLSRRAMCYLVAQQQQNGAWTYGESRMYRWIDGFHSGYNLAALLGYQCSTGDRSFDQAIQRGYTYYISNFFRPDGAPKYFHNSAYPVDIHSCSQAILTFCDFAGENREARRRAMAVTRWTLDHMRNVDGKFIFRIRRLWTDRTVYLRWGQAWMLHAMARLQRQLLAHYSPILAKGPQRFSPEIAHRGTAECSHC